VASSDPSRKIGDCARREAVATSDFIDVPAYTVCDTTKGISMIGNKQFNISETGHEIGIVLTAGDTK